MNKEDFARRLEQAVIDDDYETLSTMANELVGISPDEVDWLRQLSLVAYHNCWSHDEARDEETIDSYVA